MEIAVINSSKSLSDTDVTFMVEACKAQLVECAAAWGIPPLAAAFYAEVATLPASDVYVCEVVDDLEQPGVLGWHSDDVRPFIKVLAQGEATSVTLSHEFLETLCDPTCDQWRARGDGTQVALEVCDPVEGDSYNEPAIVLGESRLVAVSNYCLRSFFNPNGIGPFDRMGRLNGPFSMTPGGYEVVLDANGRESSIFADRVPERILYRLKNPSSRFLRRLGSGRRRSSVS
jgi:hypothetical protein